VDTLAEYDGSNALQRRFVFGPGIDEPLVQYEGSGTADRRFMGGDERGSIISLTDSAGTLLNINRYDEYGKPQSTNSGRFQYTGQKWIGEAGLYDYKARDYLPHLGIFAQTDPIGYGPSPNLYAYVGGDPVNLTDSSGQCSVIGKGISEGIYDFGSGLTDKASVVIAGGLFLKSPQAVLGGEIAAVTGTVIQAIGAGGRLISTGNVTRARYDAIGIVFSFFQSQSKAGSLALGYTGGKAVELRTRLTPGKDCK
jgi:RHS repeat-associated protein